MRKRRQPLIVKIIIWLPRWLFPVCLKGGTLFTSSARLAKDGVLPALSSLALINFRCGLSHWEQRMWKSTLSLMSRLMILVFRVALCSLMRFFLKFGRRLVGMILFLTSRGHGLFIAIAARDWKAALREASGNRSLFAKTPTCRIWAGYWPVGCFRLFPASLLLTTCMQIADVVNAADRMQVVSASKLLNSRQLLLPFLWFVPFDTELCLFINLGSGFIFVCMCICNTHSEAHARTLSASAQPADSACHSRVRNAGEN